MSVVYNGAANIKMLKVKIQCCNLCLSLLILGGVANNVIVFFCISDRCKD
jgi:hypothetical protein